MLRALQLLIAATVVLAAAGDVHARRQGAPVVCEPGEEGPLSLPVALLRSPAPAELLVAGPPADEAGAAPAAPLDDRLCVPGASDDAGCRPYRSAPAPGRFAAPILSESFVLVRRPALSPPAVRRAPAVQAESERRDAGFARRIERPPRPV